MGACLISAHKHPMQCLRLVIRHMQQTPGRPPVSSAQQPDNTLDPPMTAYKTCHVYTTKTLHGIMPSHDSHMLQCQVRHNWLQHFTPGLSTPSFPRKPRQA
jgi:hypothetical protein